MSKHKSDSIIISATQWFGIVLLLVLVGWGGKYLIDISQYEQTNDAQVDAYLAPISAKIGGYIDRIYFRENQVVHKGDTLLRIVVDEFQLKGDAAAADLLISRAKLDVLNAGEETQQRNIEVISAHIPGVLAKLEHQQQEYNRYVNLLKEESTTRQKFESVQAALLIDKSEYEEAIASMKVAQSKLKDLRAQRIAIAAEIKVKEAILARQELDIHYTVVKAPFEGQLGKKTIQEGQLVQPGQTLAFLINRDEGKWVVANFKETQVSHFSPGQAAKIKVDAFPNEIFTGTIESLSPTTGSRYSLLPPDNATGNFVKVTQRIPVRIKLNSNYSQLAPGMNASVFITK
ncbi:HlyD family secretion protein [Chitinophaga sancti]|uniref:HlyD family secretion protein n=1 Tax=Chitinophaga sancti TaxID=1004 RepID=UPI003F79FBAD